MDWNTFSNDVAVKILESGRLRELLGELGCGGLEGTNGGTTFRGPCPVHGGRRQDFMVTTEGTMLPILWACWSKACHEKYKQSLLGLVRGVLSAHSGSVSLWDAHLWLKRFLKDASTDGPTGVISLNRQEVRARLRIPSDYYFRRGFSPRVLDQFDVGHSDKLGRSVVPLYAHASETCIGWATRAGSERLAAFTGEPVEPEDEWLLPDRFPRGAYIYNYFAASRSDSPFVCLVEGPGDVWALAAHHLLAVSCVGSDVTAEQAKALLRLGKKVVVAFDNDAGGREGSADAMSRLRKLGVNCRCVSLPPAYHDLGRMPQDALKQWLKKLPV